MGGQEVDIGRRKGEPRAAGTGRYKGGKVNKIYRLLHFNSLLPIKKTACKVDHSINFFKETFGARQKSCE